MFCYAYNYMCWVAVSTPYHETSLKPECITAAEVIKTRTEDPCANGHFIAGLKLVRER